MYEFLVNLFSDDKAFSISAFSLWHFIYLFLIIAAAVITTIVLRGKTSAYVEKTLNHISIAILVVYILDFFIMPFSHGSINIDKLPFHFCTMASILIIFSRYNHRIMKYRPHILTVSLVASIIYIVYPASAFGDASPLSYRVIQTMTYHGLLVVYGVSALFTGNVKLEMKSFHKCLYVILFVIAIALVANYAYSDDLNHPYDWAFINGINFNIFSEANRRLMIFAVFTAFSLSALLFYGIAYFIEKKCKKEVK